MILYQKDDFVSRRAGEQKELALFIFFILCAIMLNILKFMNLDKIMEVTHKAQPEKKNDIAHIPFQHFASKCDVNDEVVFSALDYALEQRDVHNIAITGTYGSGKSSVLRSYINRKLLEILKNNNIISSYREKNSKFVVMHKRK